MNTKMTLSASIVLYRMISRILTDENGNEKEMPFNTKYKLHRDRSLLEKDLMQYEEKRVSLIKEYGEEQEDGTYKVVPEKEQEFLSKAQELLGTVVEHGFYKMEPTEITAINLPDASADETDLFIACLVNDPELEDSLKSLNQKKEGEVAEKNEATESATNN